MERAVATRASREVERVVWEVRMVRWRVVRVRGRVVGCFGGCGSVMCGFSCCPLLVRESRGTKGMGRGKTLCVG